MGNVAYFVQLPVSEVCVLGYLPFCNFETKGLEKFQEVFERRLKATGNFNDKKSSAKKNWIVR